MLFVTLIAILCTSATLAHEIDESLEIDPRIMRATPARIEDFPYFATIEVSGLSLCGGSILSRIWVLTAAHCAIADSIHAMNVYVGGETEQTSIRMSVSKIIVHFAYQPQGPILHDIALVRLSKPLQFSSRIQPVRLPNQDIVDYNYEMTYKVAGRGATEEESWTSLRQADFVRLPLESCINYITNPEGFYHVLYTWYSRNKYFFCAKHQLYDTAICSGDSGSPMVHNNTVVGIVSYDYGPCPDNQVSFFVKVSEYIEWIEDHTGLVPT